VSIGEWALVIDNTGDGQQGMDVDHQICDKFTGLRWGAA
jgi:hypothetical protein